MHSDHPSNHLAMSYDTWGFTWQENAAADLNAADRKSCRTIQIVFHSIALYLSQIVVNVHNDFNLGCEIVYCAFFSETFVFLWL